MDEFFNHVQEKIHDENGTTNWTRPDSFKDLNNRLLNLDWKDPGAVKDYIKACKTIRIYFEKYKEVDNWERFINGNPYGPVLTILLLEKELWDYYLTLNTGREPLDLEKEYGFSMPYPIAQHHEKLKSDLFTELGLKTEPRPGAQSEGEGVSNSIDKSIANEDWVARLKVQELSRKNKALKKRLSLKYNFDVNELAKLIEQSRHPKTNKFSYRKLGQLLGCHHTTAKRYVERYGLKHLTA